MKTKTDKINEGLSILCGVALVVLILMITALYVVIEAILP